jgi:3-methyladenine DNA glycosylase AlkC
MQATMNSSEKQKERPAIKDWFDRKAAKALAAQIGSAHAKFDRARFVRLATKDLPRLEFADRVRQFSGALRATLPESVPDALSVLTDSLPELLPGSEDVSDGWLQWPVGQFIADHGLEHYPESMAAMIELTQRFSAEFAVRPFVEAVPDRTFRQLLKLTKHRNVHVRRWCSEGTRPRLPWGRKLRDLVADPGPIWPILERLKDDSELYVRRSVANNLNDIAKDHPDRVVERCQAWLEKRTPNREWLVRHALRSLIKDGHPGALALVGFGPPEKLQTRLRVAPAAIRVGESMTMTAEIVSSARRSQRLAVDYAVHYVRKSGTSAKVFKWTTAELPAGGRVTLEKRHHMKVTTIRALYPGAHRVELQVNGVRCAKAAFQLS